MANIDKVKVNTLEATPTPRISSDEEYFQYYRGQHNGGKSEYLDNEYKGVLISDMRDAMYDISEECEIYYDIARNFGFKPDMVSMNVHGFITQTLPFFLDDEKPYVSSDDLKTIIKSINNKVVDNNFKFIIGGKEIKPKRKEYLNLNKQLNRYGRILVNVVYSEDIRDIKFEVIEPYRYTKIDDIGYEYYAEIEDYVDENGATYRSYIREIRTLTSLGVWIQKTRYYIKGLEHIPLYDDYYSYEEDVLSDSTNLFEMTTEDEESIVWSIRHELLMLTLINTAEAIEVDGSTFTIHADSRYFENGKFIQGDIYRIYNIDQSDNIPLFKTVQPELRDESYINMKNFYYKSIASDLGINPKILGLVTVVEVTATDVNSEEYKTVETINSMRENFTTMLEAPLEYGYNNLSIIMPQYYNQSLDSKAKTLNSITPVVSIEQSVSYLHPEWHEQERAEEVALVKYQTGKPLLKRDREILEKLGADLSTQAEG